MVLKKIKDLAQNNIILTIIYILINSIYLKRYNILVKIYIVNEEKII